MNTRRVGRSLVAGVAVLASLGASAGFRARPPAEARPHSYVIVVDVALVDFPGEREEAGRKLLGLLRPPYRQELAVSAAADTVAARNSCLRTRQPCDILHVIEGPTPENESEIAIRFRWEQVTGSPVDHQPMRWRILPCGLSARRVGDYRTCRDFMFRDVASALPHHDERFHD